jgi:hypothetical protein
MNKKILSIVLPLVGAISSVSNAAIEHEKFTLEIVKKQFDCIDSNIRVEDSAMGGTLIRADFLDSELFASIFVGENKIVDKKTCEIDYLVIAKPGYKLSSVSFSINGAYVVSETSRNRAKVSNRVNSSLDTYSTQRDFVGNGVSRSGDFNNIIATVSGDKLGATCAGATLIEATLLTEVIRPPMDMEPISSITLDQGQGSVDLSHIHLDHC